MKFSELGLSDKVQQAVAASGYDTPTPIQEQAIPHALAGRDVLGIAQTGTGKTAAFTLPMLSRLESGRARARMPRTLILEPTRELAAQVEEAFVKYGVNHKLNVALLIGGVSFGDQEAKITRGADVLIATPGRLLDFAERGKLLLTGIEILVIDEADRMLDMGFIPDIERICKLVPFTRQTLFFSATMPPEITRLTETFLHNPVRIEVARAASTATTITQGLVATGSGPEKRETLRRILRTAADFKNAIIFCNRKRDVAMLHKSLVTHGFSAGALHGDLDQRARMAALESFKTGEVNLLVCSDVAARGLDIPDVSHVFNFDVPTHPEDYVHRIGRTGRAGKLGTAISLVPSADQKYVDEIEKLIERKIDWMEAPAAVEAGEFGEAPTIEAGPRRNRRAKAGMQHSTTDQKTRADRSGEPRRARSEASGERGERSRGAGRGSSRRGAPMDSQAADAEATQPNMVQPDQPQEREERGPRPERHSRGERPARVERGSQASRPAREGRPARDGRATSAHQRGPAGREQSERDPPAFAPVRFADSRPPQEQAAEVVAPRFQRESERPRRDFRDRDDGPAVVGLGDHVPSFLLRAVKVRANKAHED